MKTRYILLFLFLSIGTYSQEKFDIFFDFNVEVPNESSAKNFQNWISENPKAEITKIYGYCDSVDDKSYNKELSTKRINAVIKILKESKLQLSENVELMPFGKDFKLSDNQNENRKVTFFYDNPKAQKISVLTNEEIPTDNDLNAKITKEANSLVSKFKNTKKGDIITIDNIYFHLDSDKIIEKSKPILLGLYNILLQNPNLKIKINGHICCNTDIKDVKLSSKRAQSIYTYLVEKEILFFRVTHEGFGSSKPIYKIPEKNDSEKLANRRVEILIVEK
ncbi:OmpA family protein [Flavobacterium swingsii]|uniref:OmpA family protein n=1 Tax=Flavobacterium swingsii TaxID=498292 RepID=A0A1I0W9V8_9FLAO|nr:OmpA family protein [Flavobacterium swingsii]SFA85000.1 OmpA family protein [Flavobacterium swingsii]